MRRPRALVLAVFALAGLSAGVAHTPETLSARSYAQPARPGIAAAFGRESYGPNSLGSLKLFGGGRSLSIQIFHAGVERGHTRRRDVMNGVPVSKRTRLGSRKPGTHVGVRIGAWPSGLYFAKLSAPSGRVGYAPFVVRPRRVGVHRIAVVLPTQTWQAYNFRDDDDDG